MEILIVTLVASIVLGLFSLRKEVFRPFEYLSAIVLVSCIAYGIQQIVISIQESQDEWWEQVKKNHDQFEKNVKESRKEADERYEKRKEEQIEEFKKESDESKKKTDDWYEKNVKEMNERFERSGL